MSRLDEIKALQAQIEYAHRNGDPRMEVSDLLGKLFTDEHTDWLIRQAERAEELENRNKQLEYASMHNGELNEFLQKRKLPPNTLGMHVVDVVMDYVEELEEDVNWFKRRTKALDGKLDVVSKQNQQYKQALEFYAKRSHYSTAYWKTGYEENVLDYGEVARQALKEGELE